MSDIQIHKWPNAGVVIHKATLPDSPSRFSVWLNDSGILIDAERIDRAGRSYPVGVRQRRALQRRFAYLAPRKVESV